MPLNAHLDTFTEDKNLILLNIAITVVCIVESNYETRQCIIRVIGDNRCSALRVMNTFLSEEKFTNKHFLSLGTVSHGSLRIGGKVLPWSACLTMLPSL